MAKAPKGFGPRQPQVVVLFGATGDLSRRKLIPGLFHLALAGFIPGCQIIGVSLDELTREEFIDQARSAVDEFFSRPYTDEDWEEFADRLDFVPTVAGPEALAAAVKRAEGTFDTEPQRLHYLSVPPKAALSAVHLLAQAGLVERSRVIMEKPFGVDLESAVALNAQLHEVFAEEGNNFVKLLF